MLEEAGVPMETQLIPEAVRNSSRAISNVCCTHQRIIDDVLSRGGKRTGKVRCLECGAVFNDPYEGNK